MSSKVDFLTGSKLHTKSWLIEAPLRMLYNNLHPDIAEHPKFSSLWRYWKGC